MSSNHFTPDATADRQVRSLKQMLSMTLAGIELAMALLVVFKLAHTAQRDVPARSVSKPRPAMARQWQAAFQQPAKIAT